jgi:predicted ArsR family transcriptional regulator
MHKIINNKSPRPGQPNPYIERSLDVLTKLCASATPQTREALELSTFRALSLLENKLIKRVAVHHTGQAGRPAYLYAPTAKARRAVEDRLRSGRIVRRGRRLVVVS